MVLLFEGGMLCEIEIGSREVGAYLLIPSLHLRKARGNKIIHKRTSYSMSYVDMFELITYLSSSPVHLSTGDSRWKLSTW